MMKTKNLGMTIGSILIILLLMPLGHALMIIMEHTLEPTALHYSAFAMGFVGLVITIWGVFVKGDTRQTVFGMTGALLFWTGWWSSCWLIMPSAMVCIATWWAMAW